MAQNNKITYVRVALGMCLSRAPATLARKLTPEALLLCFISVFLCIHPNINEWSMQDECVHMSVSL